MKVYKVTLKATVKVTTDITVDAENEMKAVLKAMALAHETKDTDWRPDDVPADFVAKQIEEVKRDPQFQSMPCYVPDQHGGCKARYNPDDGGQEPECKTCIL